MLFQYIYSTHIYIKRSLFSIKIKSHEKLFMIYLIQYNAKLEDLQWKLVPHKFMEHDIHNQHRLIKRLKASRTNRREMDLPYGICEKEIWAIFDFRNRWTSIVKKQIPNTYFQSERTLLTFLILKLRLVTRASYFLGRIFYFNWQVDFKTLTSGQKTMPTQKLSNQT